MNDTPHQFKVGDAATTVGYSDRHAGHIIKISKSGKRIEFQHGECKLLNGFDSNEPDKLVATPGGFCAHVSGDQRWEVKPDPTGAIEKYSLRKNGKWKHSRQPQTVAGMGIVPGHSHHYDYNF